MRSILTISRPRVRIFIFKYGGVKREVVFLLMVCQLRMLTKLPGLLLSVPSQCQRNGDAEYWWDSEPQRALSVFRGSNLAAHRCRSGCKSRG